MKLNRETIEAIDDICSETGQTEEFKRMIKQYLENCIDSSNAPGDLRMIIEKVVVP